MKLTLCWFGSGDLQVKLVTCQDSDFFCAKAIAGCFKKSELPGWPDIGSELLTRSRRCGSHGFTLPIEGS